MQHNPNVCLACKRERSPYGSSGDDGKILFGRKGWVHKACRYHRDAWENTTSSGRSDSLPKFSLEIETDGRDQWGDQNDTEQDLTLELLAHGYIPTSDGTVQTEYKSPIYLSLAAATPALLVINKWADVAITHTCGSHVHVDCPDIKSVHDDRSNLFGPLYEHMGLNRTQTQEFWGRGFNDWAGNPYNSPGLGRYCAFNTRSNHRTLEFRLAKYVYFEQYREVIRFARQATAYLEATYQQSYPAWDRLNQVGESLVDMYRSHCRVMGL